MSEDDKTKTPAPDKKPEPENPGRRDLFKLMRGQSAKKSHETGEVPSGMTRKIDTAKMTRRNVLAILGLAGLALLTPKAVGAYAKLTVPEDYQEEKDSDLAAEAMRNYGESERYMRPHEVLKMQSSQEAIYRHYINPAFVMFLEASGADVRGKRKDLVDKALKIAMEYPYFLEYIDKGNNVTEIRKRKVVPGDDPEQVRKIMSEIPDDFLIKIEKEGGYITQVGDDVLVNTMKESIPWVDGEYAERYNNLQWPRLKNDMGREVAKQKMIFRKNQAERKELDKGKPKEQLAKERTERITDIFRAILESPSGDVKNDVRMIWMEIPKRVKEMFDARNKLWKIDTEQYKIYCLDTMVKGTPKDYEAMVDLFLKTGHTQGYVLISPEDPDKKPGADNPDMYTIMFDYKEAPEEPLIITREGYILEAKPIEKIVEKKVRKGNKVEKVKKVVRDWKPIPTKKYENMLKKAYYRDYPDALKLQDLEQ